MKHSSLKGNWYTRSKDSRHRSQRYHLGSSQNRQVRSYKSCFLFCFCNKKGLTYSCLADSKLHVLDVYCNVQPLSTYPYPENRQKWVQNILRNTQTFQQTLHIKDNGTSENTNLTWSITVGTADLLLILFGFSCLAYVELATALLFCTNPSQSHWRLVVQWYFPYGECSLGTL